MRGRDPAKQKIPEWRRADEQAMAQVRASLASVKAVRVGTSRLWCCSLCPTFDAVATLMVPHLKERYVSYDSFLTVLTSASTNTTDTASMTPRRRTVMGPSSCIRLRWSLHCI